MSFSIQTKQELCRELPRRRCCLLAQVYGVLLCANQFQTHEIRIVTECQTFARQLPKLFRRAFDVTFDQLPEPDAVKQVFVIHREEALAKILDTYGYSRENSVSLRLNFAMLENDCCRIAFLRGAFLAGGAVTDPQKRYHLELVTPHGHVSHALVSLMQEVGFEPKETVRKYSHVLYFKQSDVISDFLIALGAPLAAMEVINAKVEKHLRNGVNRRFNCDVANLDKSVDAAQGQIAAIRRLKAEGRLAALPVKLRETAELRLANPELSLTQLAELCDPPVSKSCINHRMRKLMELGGQD